MMRTPASCSVHKLRAALVVVLTMLVTLCPQTVPAQNNWQQQQMWQQQRQMEMQRQQQRQLEMQRQQQMRQQQAMQQRQMQQQQQRMQWGQRSQQSSTPAPRTIQPWRPSQPNVQRPSQGQQRTAQPWQRSSQTTVQRQLVPQRTFAPQRTGIARANQAAVQRRDVFNAQRGVTVRVSPNRTARVLVTRSPNRTEIAQGFRGRYSGDRAVVTVRGKTFTVPRSMVNNRSVGTPTRVTFARRPAAVGSGGNGGPPRRWVLAGTSANGSRNNSGKPASSSNGGFGNAANEIGILRDAARGKGNFGLGQANLQDTMRLGKAWVGQGYSVASDGKTLVSADKLRQFRPPSFKPRLGKQQSNFEKREHANQAWQSNGHLDILE